MTQRYRLDLSDGTTVADSVELATGPWSRFCGLMFRRDLPDGHALVLRPCSSVHMFFMRFALDVVFVDGDGVVLRVLHDLRPWRASSFVRGARSAIELRASTARHLGIERGSVLRLVVPAES